MTAWRRHPGTACFVLGFVVTALDCLGRRLLDGVTRDSVARLLGPRDATPYFAEWELVYWLGPERGLIRIHSEWLVAAFGADGRVSAARIVRDWRAAVTPSARARLP